jgi:21S rRNA (GM2251-2'-O)-methyltransferase
MINISRLDGIACIRRTLSTSRQYHAGRAASVNTAIERGIRKSKGLAFRTGPGSARNPNDPRTKYASENPSVELNLEKHNQYRQSAGNEKQKNEAWQKPAGREVREGRGRDKGPDVKIRRGIKVIKTNDQLDRKRPNPAGRSSGGRSGFSVEGRANAGFNEITRSSQTSFGRPTGSHREERGFGREDRERKSGRDAEFLRREWAPRPMETRNDRGRDSSGISTSHESISSSGSTRDSSKYTRNRPQHWQGRGSVKGRDEDTAYHHKRGGPSVFEKRERSSRATESPTDRGVSERTFRLRDEFKSTSRERFPRATEKSGERGSSERTSRPRGEFNETSGNDALGFSPPEKKSWKSSTNKDEIATSSVDETAEKDSSGSRVRISKHTVEDRVPLSIPYTTPASEFLYGTSVVEAALTSRRVPSRTLHKLYIYTGENRERSSSDRDVDIAKLGRGNGVKVIRMNSGDDLRLMDKMSGGRPHNGYVLEASPLPRLPITRLAELTTEDGVEGFKVTVAYQSKEDAAINGTKDFIKIPNSKPGSHPMVLYLDSIVDPGNLGGIIRTASFLGVTAVAISSRNSASFTPVVLKASAGASENITLFSVSGPEVFIQASREAGWKVFAAVAPATGRDAYYSRKSVSTDRLGDPLAEGPCILMLGGEGEGLRMNLRRKADVEVYIPGSSQRNTVDSLNVSVAAGILCSAFVARRRISAPLNEIASKEDEDEETEEASSNTLF